MFEEYRGRRVLITGHTGFKGSWLALWLRQKGATIAGISLPPEPGHPSLFKDARVDQGMESTLADIREFENVERCMAAFRPQVVFHLAGQALVRRSYRDPVGTFASNVMGTVHVLEATRRTPSVQAVVCVTTDKVYKNREWMWGYREIEELGGKDPYSASKVCAELVAGVYMDALFPLGANGALATARGGNVVGGGDWSEDRLIPDIVRSLVASEEIVLRNPHAVRPWQHVIELCRGYLRLGTFLLEEPDLAIGAWNFGPERENEVEVGTLVADFLRAWGPGSSVVRIEPASIQEAGILKLDNTRARKELGWHPLLGYNRTLQWTAQWYSDFYNRRKSATELVAEQLQAYEELALR